MIGDEEEGLEGVGKQVDDENRKKGQMSPFPLKDIFSFDRANSSSTSDEIEPPKNDSWILISKAP